MYGSIFRMKVRPGQEDKLIEAFHRWETERKPKVTGAIASYVLRSDDHPGQFVGVAVFKDKASYAANADDPEQDKWYRQMRTLLQSDVEWQDGEYVFAATT
jgi:quinol monooxygenase YgiN